MACYWRDNGCGYECLNDSEASETQCTLRPSQAQPLQFGYLEPKISNFAIGAASVNKKTLTQV